MNLDIAALSDWSETKRTVFTQINAANIPLVLFGYSPAVDPQFLSEIHVPVRHLCDNDPRKWGSHLWGLEAISPSSLPELYEKYNILILVPFEREISAQVQSLSIAPSSIYHLDLYYDEPAAADYFRTHTKQLAEVFQSLADDISRETYQRVIQYRLTRDSAYLSEISLPRGDQYFPPFIGDKTPFLSSHEVFVDAGAFIGDTVEKFISVVDTQYKAIYAFEPDPENFKKLERCMSPLLNTICIQAGVGKQRMTAHFSSNDSGSRLETSGAELVEIQVLDQTLEGIPVTYLKMDIEGMECSALNGARNLITQYHPKLAICTYHSNADMIDVPLLLKQFNPNYKLYFRHYTNSLVETVCYAVP